MIFTVMVMMLLDGPALHIGFVLNGALAAQ